MLLTFAILVLLSSSNKFILKFKPRYDISYGIYLWGFLIQQTLYYYLGFTNAFFHLFIALLIATILALISFLFIEKPFIILGKKLFISYQNKRVKGFLQ